VRSPIGIVDKLNWFALERDFHLTASIDPGPARARRSPYLHIRSKIELKPWKSAHPHYLITTEVLLSSTKEPVLTSQVDKSLVGCFVNPPFTIIRLSAINAKNLQSMFTHGIDKLTSKLSHTMEELNTTHQSQDFVIKIDKDKPQIGISFSLGHLAQHGSSQGTQ